MTRRAPDHSDFLARGELADEAELERAMAADPEGTLRRREFLGRTAAAAGAASLASLLPAEQLIAAAAKKKGGSGKLPSPRELPIDTFVVLMMENRSFDHYFGWHPGADAKNTGLSYPDVNGNPVPTHHLSPDFQGCDFRDPDHGWVGGRHQWNGGAQRRLRHRQPGRRRLRRVRRRLLPEGRPRLHPARGRQVHPLRPLVLLDHGLDLPEPPLPVGRAERRSEVEPVPVRDRGGRRLQLGDDLRPGALEGGELHLLQLRPALLRALRAARHLVDQADRAVLRSRPPRGRCRTSASSTRRSRTGAGETGPPPTSTRTATSGSGRRSCPTSPTPSSSRRSTSAGRCSSTTTNGAASSTTSARRSSPTTARTAPTSRRTGASPASASRASRSRPSRAQGGVSHLQVTHESILKLISYKFGLGHLNKRHRYASNIGRSFHWKRKNMNPPALPDPVAIAATPVLARRLLAQRRRDQRPAEAARPGRARDLGAARPARLRGARRLLRPDLPRARQRPQGAARLDRLSLNRRHRGGAPLGCRARREEQAGGDGR